MMSSFKSKVHPRFAFVVVAGFFGLVVLARMIFGPHRGPIPFSSPLNVESFFGVAATLLVLSGVSRARSQAGSPREPEGGWLALDMAALALLVLGVYWRALGSWFLSDDFVLLKLAQSPSLAWFTAPGGDGFFRPVGYVSLALNRLLVSVNPVLWHSSTLALHFVNSALVFFLSRRLAYSRGVSWFAAALFAVHGTRPEVAVWIAGRFDLVATFFALAGLLLFEASLDATALVSRIYKLAALACMVLGMLSKESAYVFPALLALLLIFKREPLRKRAGELAVFVAAALVLFAYRWSLVGGFGGYADAASGQSQMLNFKPLMLAKALFYRLWATLYFPLNWSREPGALLALATLIYVICLLRLVVVRCAWREVALALGFILTCALPPIQQLLIGQDLQKSRLLYLPSVGFCLLLAALLAGLRGREQWIVGAGIIVFNLSALSHNLTPWDHASLRAKTACEAAARCARNANRVVVAGLPDSLEGVYFFRNGFAECLEMENPDRPIAVDFRQDAIAAGDRDSTRLIWNKEREELSCAR